MSDLKIFTENIDPKAAHLVYTVAALPPFEGVPVRVMPDVHYSAGCAVGFTAPLTDKIVPNLLGVDLGCGMLVAELGKTEIDFPALDAFIKEKIPAGSAVRAEGSGDAEKLIKELACFRALRDPVRPVLSLGTLGGGNHFIEADEDGEGNRYLIVHSGSRNLGLQVAKLYAARAVQASKTCAEGECAEAAASLKGNPGEIAAALARIRAKYAFRTKIPTEFCYLDGADMAEYLHDVRLCQTFASLNRMRIAREISRFLGIRQFRSFETVHNFVGADNIVRKGAISAHAGERVVIPMNMRDGVLFAVGKGNADWNFSAPHGAGRLCKRDEAKARFTEEEFKAQMKGIYTTTATAATIDESPMAYKPMEEIVSRIAPAVDIEFRAVPLYNFKAGTAD